nr:hypothetical protein [Stenotrophomonas pavanii]
MQIGNLTHQVVLSVPMGPYLDLSRRIRPDFHGHIVDSTTGYLLLVARSSEKSVRSWECLRAGSREHICQTSPELAGGDLDSEVGRLKGWLHELIETAVSMTDVSLEVFRDVRVQLQVSAELLQRVSELPLTVALRAEGAFDAETSTMNLQADSSTGLARRLGWLLEISRAAHPAFQPVIGVPVDRLGMYLVRVHGRQLLRRQT